MSQFFARPAGLTVREIADLTGAAPRTGARLDAIISGIAALERARPSDLAFIDDEKQAAGLHGTRAGLCLAARPFADRAPAALTVLVTAEPFRDFVTVATKLYPDSLGPRSLFGGTGVAEGAVVHPGAEIEDGVTIDPGAVIGPGAGIGEGTVIAANAVIGPDVQIGRGCSVGSGASVMHALIGDGVVLHPGCRIGQDGIRGRQGAGGRLKVPQLGRVIVQDRVEIGANTTVDRGSSGDTVIGEGAKIDNLVQIGHNVTVGRHCILAAHCALSQGVALGDYVILEGQVGVADHVVIGEGVRIGAKTAVASDVPIGAR